MSVWIERQRYLMDYTLAAMGRRWARNLGLVAVYTLLVFVLASVMMFTDAIQREAGLLLEQAPEVVVQRMVAGRHDLISAAYMADIEAIRGARQARGRLWGYHFDPVTAANYTFMVPAADAPPAGAVDIGSGLARARGAAPGDVLSFRGHDGGLFTFEVRRLLTPESEIITADAILVSEADFRAFFGIRRGLFTDISLRVRNPREVTKVAEKIVERFPDTRPILRSEMQRTYASLFDWRQGLVLAVFSGALLAFAILAWDKASGLSAEERREIGILKAVGWETADIIAMKTWEGALVSVTAFLLGVLLAYGHVFGASAVMFEPVLKGWATLYPRFTLTPRVDLFQLAVLLFLTVVPYTAATVVPNWKTAVTDPDAVMR
ncbi:MAG: FtsX-like permease family protein [Gammaproteobacteria bacterium]|nr:FtsX-like permease family protein [Gammaproteobacteria bacterium]